MVKIYSKKRKGGGRKGLIIGGKKGAKGDEQKNTIQELEGVSGKWKRKRRHIEERLA